MLEGAIKELLDQKWFKSFLLVLSIQLVTHQLFK